MPLFVCFVFFLLAGSYVALTVLGRPPGLAQIPLSEAESEMLGVSISSPNSPATEHPYSPQDRLSSTQPPWVLRTSVVSLYIFAFSNFSSLFWFLLCLPVSTKYRLIYLVTSFYLISSKMNLHYVEPICAWILPTCILNHSSFLCFSPAGWE